jgi:hypothetical protein
MKNKLSDLTNHMFAVIERLNDEDLEGEKLAVEINRSDAITRAALCVVAAGNLMYKAHMATVEWESLSKKKLPETLE